MDIREALNSFKTNIGKQMNNPLNSSGITKKTFVIFAIVALIVVGVAAAVTYSFQPSNDLKINEKPSAPVVIGTILTSDKLGGSFNSGDSITLIATLSQPIAGVTVAFQVVVAGSLTAPGYAVTNAQGVASFTFTPSSVDVATDRTFRATPQA